MGRTPAGRSTLPSRGRPRSSDKHAALRADARLGRDAHRPACLISSRSPGSRVGCGRELACRSTTNSRGRGALDSTGTCEHICSGWRPTARRTEGSTGWAARTARTVHRPSAEPAPQALGTAHRVVTHIAHKDARLAPRLPQSARPGSRCRILRIRGRTRVSLERKSSALISSTTPSQQQASWR